MEGADDAADSHHLEDAGIKSVKAVTVRRMTIRNITSRGHFWHPVLFLGVTKIVLVSKNRPFAVI